MGETEKLYNTLMEIVDKNSMLEEGYKEAASEIAMHIDAETLWLAYLKIHPGWHLVKILWNPVLLFAEAAPYWNELTQWIINQFGPPGDTYVTHTDMHEMIFLFKNEEDAILTILRWK